jgi:hypothetical protein
VFGCCVLSLDSLRVCVLNCSFVVVGTVHCVFFHGVRARCLWMEPCVCGSMASVCSSVGLARGAE